ncbi:hypothetical protein HMPREF0762_01958 [Slackia exigua ATCC 700122]|uniref:Uncharacterized protein n=1 Tax=Slackia exigua (strain ATCC 700122 / DSM 15923 / CIP 105133 / JCM 11022 / KCTC 5966 / S-7) TaxID=649764 RepID=D0WJD1_SLAES|nr:hypothetical protein HMPREF0762_01958 [Slackia exigua ATCC 700122]
MPPGKPLPIRFLHIERVAQERALSEVRRSPASAGQTSVVEIRHIVKPRPHAPAGQTSHPPQRTRRRLCVRRP